MNEMSKPVAPLSASTLARFVAVVGEKNAITDREKQTPYLVEFRGLWTGHTPVVLRPGSTAEVSELLKIASETATAIVPQGGNTGLVGGQISHNGEVVLSLNRMDRIREVDPVSNTITCEAGVTLQRAREAAANVDRLYPQLLPSEGTCTIGGNLSTNAGGTAALAHGIARSHALGLEVVLADGRVMHNLNKLKKDNTGYDLRNLFIGAEGTLGIITAAVLKMFPRPRSVETAFIGLSSPQAALELLNLAQERFGNTITSFELLARIALEMTVKHGANCRDPLGGAHDWYVLMEISSQSSEGVREQLEDLLATGIERGIVGDAAIAANLEQAKAFWHLRLEMSDAQKPEGGSIKHDVSVPISAVPAFLAEAGETVLKLVPAARLVPFGHLGDGNIHYNVSQPLGADKAAFLARWHEVNDAVHAIVAKYRGSISAEHGIGVLKRDLLPHVKDVVALDVMKSLKRSFDPNNILNPGKVL
jgi:FAD/FMN-containing dehydrogenase